MRTLLGLLIKEFLFGLNKSSRKMGFQGIKSGIEFKMKLLS